MQVMQLPVYEAFAALAAVSAMQYCNVVNAAGHKSFVRPAQVYATGTYAQLDFA